VHTYEKRWCDGQDDGCYPELKDFLFTGPLDVVRFAELDPAVTWRTWPEVWHLDDDGAFCCASRGSSFDSVRTFADDPAGMLRCREIELDDSCPNRWLVIESRRPHRKASYRPDEGDAQAFVELRRGLGRFGITLLDVMIFDQEFHWWSLHELTSGKTSWS
jgi:hypothetical protein